MSDEKQVSVHMWRFDPKGDAGTPAGQPADPGEERAKQRQEWRQGRGTFYLPPPESFEKTCERVQENGPQAAAAEIRNLGTDTINLRNAVAWLSERLRYCIGERDGLEEHLRLALEEAKMHAGQRKIAEEALHRTCDERDALKKQLRDLAPAKPKAAKKP